MGSDLKRYFEHELFFQQSVAFNLLQRFISGSNSRIFILKGYAGTGKTTLMSGFIKWLREQHLTWVLLASTGRASKVLSDKTETLSNTIHSFIYIFRDWDDDLDSLLNKEDKLEVNDKGQISLLFDLKVVGSNLENIYIVDEASMISDTSDANSSFAKFGNGKLLTDLLRFDAKGRFIFVGDPCQLPPVGQGFSPALSKEYIEKTFGEKVVEYEMTEVVRQAKKNGIIDASLKLRFLRDTNPAVKWASLPLKGHSNIVLHESHASLLRMYINKVKEFGFDYTTLLCQTNRHCSDLNRILRPALGLDSYSLAVNDILLVTQNNNLTGLVNGDIIKVNRIGNRIRRCDLSFVNVEVQELVSKRISEVLLIENILGSMVTNLNSKQHKDLMVDFYLRMKSLGIKQKDEAFKIRMLEDPFLNALRSVYGYALTCHKGQGGEWNEVFLYLDNKIHGIPKPEIYQWLYTAVTRAKVTLHIVDDWFVK